MYQLEVGSDPFGGMLSPAVQAELTGKTPAGYHGWSVRVEGAKFFARPMNEAAVTAGVLSEELRLFCPQKLLEGFALCFGDWGTNMPIYGFVNEVREWRHQMAELLLRED